MKNQTKEPVQQNISAEDIVNLIEDVRLTTLNLAIASSKFKSGNSRQDLIRKDLVDVVTMALESIQSLSKFLEIIGVEGGSHPALVDNVDHRKLENNFERVAEYLKRIADNFSRDRGLE
jgi:hypothetical protein